MSKNLIDVILELQGESSTNKKVEILQENKNFGLLKKFFFICLDPFTNFYVREYEKNSFGNEEFSEAILDGLIWNLCNRQVTGNAAKKYLADLHSTLNADGQDILQRLITRDPMCKVSVGLVNRVWGKDFVSESNCMLAEKFNKKSKVSVWAKPYMVQKKEDGGRVQIVVGSDGSVSVYSRSGNELLLHNVFDSYFDRFKSMVFDGELLVVNKSSGVEKRQAGNGFMNKAVRGTITKEEAETFIIVLWDCIPLDDWSNKVCHITNKARFDHLKSLDIFNEKVHLVENFEVESIDDALKIYQQYLDNGFEGAMLKNPDGIWEAKRSKDVLKLKAEKTIDLLCVGYKQHTKNSDMIGSLECQDSTGKLLVSLGTGLTEDDRLKNPTDYVGKIIEVVYNDVITSKGKDTVSLFLPVYKSIRLDKTVADSI